MSREAQREMKHFQIPGYSAICHHKGPLKASGERHTIASVIPAVLLGRNPVLFSTLGSKELDSGLKIAGMTGGRYSQTMGFVLRRLRAVFHTKPRIRKENQLPDNFFAHSKGDFTCPSLRGLRGFV
jgi:hypothetical protein